MAFALQEAVGVSLMGKAPQYQMAFLLFGQPGAENQFCSPL